VAAAKKDDSLLPDVIVEAAEDEEEDEEDDDEEDFVDCGEVGKEELQQFRSVSVNRVLSSSCRSTCSVRHKQ
jgi:hypothetical protein